MKKGALSLSMLGLYVLFVVGAITLLAPMPELIDYFFSSGKREVCKASVVLASQRVQGKSLFSIQCEPEEAEIGSSYMQGESLDTEKLKRTLAEHMKRCWYKMGEGHVEPYSSEAFNENHACTVCSELSVSQDVRVALEKQGGIQGFTDYLNSTEMEDSDKTYWQYLSKQFSAGTYNLFWYPVAESEVKSFKGVDTLPPSDEYMVVFKQIEEAGQEDWIIGDLFEAFGTDETIPLILVSPKEEFGSLRCDYLIQ